MRICYLAPTEAVPGWGGGVHTLELARALARRGHTVHVICALPEGEKRKNIIIDGVHLHRIPRTTVPRIASISATFLSCIELVRLLLSERFDVLYERAYTYNLAGLLGRTLTGKTLVSEVHCDYVEEGISRGIFARGGLHHRAVEALRRMTFAKSAVLLSMEFSIIPLYVPRKKIRLIENAADCEKFHPAADGTKVRKKFGLEGKKVVAYTGTFYSWHGILDLIESARLLRRDNIAFLIVGGGEEFEAAKDMVKEHALKNVTLTGFLPHQEIPQYLAAADIAAAPFNEDKFPLTRKKGFFWSPIKLFEYMAAGKPIMTTNVGKFGEMVSANRIGLVARSGDPASIARTIEKMLASKDLTGMGIRARKLAVAKYSWDAVAEQIERTILEKTAGCK